MGKAWKGILCFVLCMGLLGCSAKVPDEEESAVCGSEAVSSEVEIESDDAEVITDDIGNVSGDTETEESSQKQEAMTETQILWEVPVEILVSDETELNTWEPYYTQNQGGIVHFAQYGNWKWPLGLYSFAVSEGMLFVDDSASRRVAILQEGKDNQYISMPENYVCHSMRYDDESGILYLLLEDITAVERGKTIYMSYDVAKGEEIEAKELTDAAYVYTLDERGELYQRPMEYSNIEYSEFLREQVKQLVGLDKESRGTDDYLSQYGDKALYAYYEEDNDNMYLFVVQGEEIITHTKALNQSDINWQKYAHGYLYEKEGELHIAYMLLTEDGKLQIMQVK